MKGKTRRIFPWPFHSSEHTGGIEIYRANKTILGSSSVPVNPSETPRQQNKTMTILVVSAIYELRERPAVQVRSCGPGAMRSIVFLTCTPSCIIPQSSSGRRCNRHIFIVDFPV